MTSRTLEGMPWLENTISPLVTGATNFNNKDRTLCNAQRLQDAVDKELAIEALSRCLNIAHQVCVTVRRSQLRSEDVVKLCVVIHGGGGWRFVVAVAVTKKNRVSNLLGQKTGAKLGWET